VFEGGTPDMSALLAQAQRLQEELVAAKDRLAEARVEGSAASGLVTATVSGTGELLTVTIKPEACDPDDAETLGDMVVAAVRDANEQAGQLAAEQMGPLAGGLDAIGGGPQPEGGGPAGFALPG
jgi:nucleoid-associated protein EbfC